MKYRRFGKLDWQVSALGFGCMRLPEKNKTKAIEMLRWAIDRGVNYLDTAYAYGWGKNEKIVGRALRDGYRQKVKIATKIPAEKVENASDFDLIFNGQLKRLEVDFIDFYLLHALSNERWGKLRRLGILKWVKKKITEGKIKYLGFSFHDELAVFKKIIDATDLWSFCQIQYNFMNEKVQAGKEGLHYAAKKGLAVVIMEPLLGGLLIKPPPKVEAIYKQIKQKPVNLALRWLWDQPEVSVVLSGMNDFNQVKENVNLADKYGNSRLSVKEKQWIKKIQQAYRQYESAPCTGCGYCLPCPRGVDIPQNFTLYNQAVIFGKEYLFLSKLIYHNLSAKKRASNCVACRVCEKKCPQKIAISSELIKVRKKFDR